MSDDPLPPVRTRNPVRAQGNALVAVDALGERGVVEVETEQHGTLAVGMADGRPFAVSNLCRHQGAKLGRGHVTENGMLQCPWHRACFDVTDGRMTSGPKGKIFGFPPYSKAVEGFGRVIAPLRRFDVEVRDGMIVLLG